MLLRKKTYSEEFKRNLVGEALSGSASVADVAERYGVSSGLLYRWIRQFEGTQEPASEDDTRALKARVAELERMVGRLAMENDFLKKFAAYARQQTSARSSVITAKTLKASVPVAGSLALPEARTTTVSGLVRNGSRKNPNSKSG